VDQSHATDREPEGIPLPEDVVDEFLLFVGWLLAY
jgi:hypothetical protein